MKSISEELKSCGLKVTPQRLAIFNILKNTNSHPNAETIYKSLGPTHPSMSLATVYKTLDTLKKAKLIQELNVGEGHFRYDANSNPHPHMLCSSCGKVYDLPISEKINLLKDELSSLTGFDIISEKITFWGFCDKCKNHLS